MSVVDTWDWDKLKPGEENGDMFKMSADMKIQMALYDFENTHGIHPNRITMGYNLLDELTNQFYNNAPPIKTIEDLAREKKLGVFCKYQGIPVRVDYNSPELLEVGYMIER